MATTSSLSLVVYTRNGWYKDALCHLSDFTQDESHSSYRYVPDVHHYLVAFPVSLLSLPVVLEQTSPAHPCPSDQVNLTCTLPGNLLIWTVPDMMEADHSLSLAVFCNTQLPMMDGSYQSVLVGCSHDGSSITSTLMFNIFQTVHIKCWNGTHHSQAELTVPLGKQCHMD